MIVPHVLAIQPVNDQGCLRAYVSIRIGPQVVRRVRWVQQPGQRPFMQPPMETTTGPDGRTRYLPLVEWPEEWRQAITAAILDALRDHPDGLRQVPTATVARTETPATFGGEFRRKAGIGGRA